MHFKLIIVILKNKRSHYESSLLEIFSSKRMTNSEQHVTDLMK